jgi:hypothetical protein
LHAARNLLPAALTISRSCLGLSAAFYYCLGLLRSSLTVAQSLLGAAQLFSRLPDKFLGLPDPTGLVGRLTSWLPTLLALPTTNPAVGGYQPCTTPLTWRFSIGSDLFQQLQSLFLCISSCYLLRSSSVVILCSAHVSCSSSTSSAQPRHSAAIPTTTTRATPAAQERAISLVDGPLSQHLWTTSPPVDSTAPYLHKSL